MIDLVALKAANAKRWEAAKQTRDFSGVARRLIAPAAKTRYQAVQANTGVPWWAIAVIHEREASQQFDTQLGQGDPLNEVSHHIPAGRGPFKTWEDGAIDALVNCAPHAASWTDWSIGGALTLLEEYNGLGYARRGLPSPYIWSGTDQYEKGKFVSDGVFDAEVVDRQLGCAGLLRAMTVLDSTIGLDGPPRAVPPPRPAPPAQPTPSVTHPARGSIGEFIANIIAAFFKRKS